MCSAKANTTPLANRGPGAERAGACHCVSRHNQTPPGPGAPHIWAKKPRQPMKTQSCPEQSPARTGRPGHRPLAAVSGPHVRPPTGAGAGAESGGSTKTLPPPLCQVPLPPGPPGPPALPPGTSERPSSSSDLGPVQRNVTQALPGRPCPRRSSGGGGQGLGSPRPSRQRGGEATREARPSDPLPAPRHPSEPRTPALQRTLI